MRRLIHSLILLGLLSGVGCIPLGEESFSYGIRYHSFVDIYDVSLSIEGRKVGPSPNVYGSKWDMGSTKRIGLVNVPLGDVAVLAWKDENGNPHKETIKIGKLLPDQWKAHRDAIVFTFRSNDEVHVSFLIKKGDPTDWYELPPKSGMEQEN